MSKIYPFRAHPEIKNMANQIATTFGVGHIDVFATNNCLACVTVLKHNRHGIAYSPAFMNKLGYWAKVAVLSHEVAHIYNNDTSRRPRNWVESHWRELNADWFAGWALYYYGADLDEALQMYDQHEFELSPTHPSEELRRKSLRSGWLSARNYFTQRNVG